MSARYPDSYHVAYEPKFCGWCGLARHKEHEHCPALVARLREEIGRSWRTHPRWAYLKASEKALAFEFFRDGFLVASGSE